MAEVRERMVIDVKEIGIEQVQSKFMGLTGTMAVFAKSLLGIGTAMAALNGAMRIFNAAISEARTGVEAYRMLESRISSTGGAAGFTADKLQAMASSLQDIGNYDDEAIMGMQSLLLTFTNIKGSTFTDAQKIIMDMATVMGTDLKSAAIQVGKALQDPILGITALRRVGVNFNESQKEVIKNLVETGRSAEAQTLIIKELKTEFGGATEAMARSSTQLRNAFADLIQEIGTSFLPYLDGFNDALTGFIKIQIEKLHGANMSLAESQKYTYMATSEFWTAMVMNFDVAAVTIVNLVGYIWNSVSSLAAGIADISTKLGTTLGTFLKKAGAAGMDAAALGDLTALKDLLTELNNVWTKGWNTSNLEAQQKNLVNIGRVVAEYEKNFLKIQEDNSLKYDERTKKLKELNREFNEQINLLGSEEIYKANGIMYEFVNGFIGALDEADQGFKDSVLSESQPFINWGKAITEVKSKVDELNQVWSAQKIEEQISKYRELGQTVRDVFVNEISFALNTMVLSHETAFNKLKSIMQSFVDAMISELNRYIAKLVFSFALKSILGLFSPSVALTGIGAFTQGLLGGNNTGSIPSISGTEQRLTQRLDNMASVVNNRPVEVKVYVDPRDVSRAAEYGQTLRYSYGAN